LTGVSVWSRAPDFINDCHRHLVFLSWDFALNSPAQRIPQKMLLLYTSLAMNFDALTP